MKPQPAIRPPDRDRSTCDSCLRPSAVLLTLVASKAVPTEAVLCFPCWKDSSKRPEERP